MTEKMDKRLKKALRRCKIAWWVIMFAAGWWAGTYLVPLAWLLLIPFGFISYAICLFVTVNILASTIPPEEIAEADRINKAEEYDRARLEAVAKIAERQAAGEEIPTEEIMETLKAAGIEVVKVVDTGPVIGSYRDKDIYQFIIVQQPKHDTPDEMTYYGPANIVNGIAQIPEIPGMIFACVENILYAKETAK